MMTYKAFLKTLLVAGFALSLAACGDGEAEDAGEELRGCERCHSGRSGRGVV